MGCLPCLRRELLDAVRNLLRKGSPAPGFGLCKRLAWSVQNLIYWLLLPFLGASAWLRDGLEEVGISWAEFRQKSWPTKSPLTLPQKAEFAGALSTLLHSVAASDGKTDAQEWAALRSYLRYFWSTEPEIFAQLNPGKEIPPSPKAQEAASAIVKRYLERHERGLFLHMLLGLAEQSDGVVPCELDHIRKLAQQCGIPDSELAYFLPVFASSQKQRQTNSSSFKQKPRREWATQDPWILLGITRQASRKEMRMAYLKLAKENHPDRFVHLGSAYTQQAHENMKRINAAYQQVLQNDRNATSTAK